MSDVIWRWLGTNTHYEVNSSLVLSFSAYIMFEIGLVHVPASKTVPE